VLSLISGPGIANATPAEELEQARESFLSGDYEGAVGRFSALLYPKSRLAEASTIAQAHLLLGVCYFETKQLKSAETEFEEALFLDSLLRLDANIFSAEVIEFFNAKREELEKAATAAAEREQLTRKQQALDRAIKNLVVLEKQRYWVNFVPFGAGQFQNGQKRKGFTFFAAETLTGGVSVGLWSYQVIKYGFRGKVPRDEVSTVNTLQVVQIGSGVVFFGLLAWGIVDSLSNYEHAVTRQADPSLIKELEDIYDIKPTTSMQLVPLITNDGGGMSAVWEF
jgi:tetratricopeptide (TPR) repeat protein